MRAPRSRSVRGRRWHAELDGTASEQDQHEPRTDGRGGDATRERVRDPTAADLRSLPARSGEIGTGAHRDRRDGRTRTGARAEHPGRRRRREEHRGEPENQHEPGEDEGDAADDRTGRARDLPRAQDGELGRSRAGQEVARGNAMFEVAGRDPAATLYAKLRAADAMCAGGPPKPMHPMRPHCTSTCHRLVLCVSEPSASARRAGESAGGSRRERGVEGGECLVDLVFAHDERRHEADDVAVGAARHEARRGSPRRQCAITALVRAAIG